MMKSLAQQLDQAGFEIFAKHQPDVIAAINAALDHGDTAHHIEKALFKRFGTMSLTAALAAGAAHYLEAQRKVCPICRGRGHYNGLLEETGTFTLMRCPCQVEPCTLCDRPADPSLATADWPMCPACFEGVTAPFPEEVLWP